MHPDLEKMVVLQGFDVEARRLSDEIAELPKRVAQLAADQEKAKKELDVIVASLSKEETLRRRQELILVARVAMQMSYETSMFSKGPRLTLSDKLYLFYFVGVTSVP